MASVISRNDKFCVVYSYFDKDGKRRQKWETFKTLGIHSRLAISLFRTARRFLN